MRSATRAFAAAIALGLAILPAAAQQAQHTTIYYGVTLIGNGLGDVKYPKDFKHWDYVNPNAPKGGDFRQYAIGSFDSFNSFIVKGLKAGGIGMLTESLFAGNGDEEDAEYGLIAENMEVPDDLSWVIFNLRPQARWSDGTPITVDDVIFSLETLKTKVHPFYKQYFANLSKAEQVGPRAVKIAFDTGGELNRELPVISAQMPVISKAYWTSHDITATTLTPFLGSGPYKVKSFKAPSTITYERDPNYWGKDLPQAQGLNNFDTLTIDYYLDETVALEAFKAGEYDFRLESTSKVWAVDYDSPALQKGLIVKTLIPDDTKKPMQGFVFNVRKPKFQDRKVREAMQYFFDFEWSNNTLFYGQYTRTRSFFEKSELAATGLPTGKELEILTPYKSKLPPEVFTTEYSPPKSDGTGNNRPMLQKAQQLLQDAGYTVVGGKLVKGGEQLKIEFLNSNPAFERVVGPVVQNMQRLGIDATLRTVDTSQFKERTDNFDYDVIVDVLAQSLSPGNEQRDFWGCDSAKDPGGRNSAGICDPVVEDLIQKIIAAPDRATLIATTHALDRVLQWGFYVVPNWYIAAFRVAYWDKFGRPDVNPKMGPSIAAWWVDPAKVRTVSAGKAQLGR